ncbi:MAG: hypothetical protein ACFFDF_05280 [Candidatus Odinarchaeota archaeon]
MARDLILLLKNNKTQFYQIAFTSFTIIMTVIIPIINYINLKTLIKNLNCANCPNLADSSINLGGLDTLYNSLIYFFIISGLIVSICAYFIFKYQKYSVQRALLLLIVSIMYFTDTVSSSQLSIIFIEVAKIQIITNFSGVYILFIVIMSLYVFKNVFDVIDFKVNHSHYVNVLRKERSDRTKYNKFHKKLIKCPKCKYMCRIGWKKCPICKTKI